MVARNVEARAEGALEERVRRSPEEAHPSILDAADRVFSLSLPDAVGLKEIAREAAVSHALVTHYFGTYDGLVDAALERRFQAPLRESLVERALRRVRREPRCRRSSSPPTAGAIARHASDLVTARLAMWATMSGRTSRKDFVAHRVQGLRLLADALQQRIDVPREDLEFCLVASFALTVVWTVGGDALSGALGKKKPRANDTRFEERVARIIDTYLRETASST